MLRLEMWPRGCPHNAQMYPAALRTGWWPIPQQQRPQLAGQCFINTGGSLLGHSHSRRTLPVLVAFSVWREAPDIGSQLTRGRWAAARHFGPKHSFVFLPGTRGRPGHFGLTQPFFPSTICKSINRAGGRRVWGPQLAGAKLHLLYLC